MAFEGDRMRNKSPVYLSIRAQMGLARVIATFDRVEAVEAAEYAIKRLASNVFSTQYQEDQWGLSYILLDPALAKCHAYLLRVKAYHEGEIRKASERIKAYADALEAETPSAEAIYAMLSNGESLKVDGHYLEYDSDMESMCGTNPYGCDYYYGNLTLENVTQWRKTVLRGITLGDAPPGCSEDDSNRLTIAQRDYREAQEDFSYFESIMDEVLS